MPHDLRDRVLALAGIFQATALVRSTARSGREIVPAVQASIHSVFRIDADSVVDVYGGPAQLALGLDVLRQQLDGGERRTRDVDLTRYVVAVLFLERKLSRNRKMLEDLGTGIEAARSQAEYFGSETHPAVIARLADLYVQSISSMTPRIMVTGEPSVLQNPDNANFIRALLLAGIRSAVLWRQCGGSRLQLLLRRQAMVRLAADLRRDGGREPL